MENQHALDFTDPPARARRTDAESSHQAAARANRTGRAAAQRARVFAMIEAYPGHTTAELAALTGGADRSMIARRCPELREAGVVRNERRVCVVQGTLALTWWAT